MKILFLLLALLVIGGILLTLVIRWKLRQTQYLPVRGAKLPIPVGNQQLTVWLDSLSQASSQQTRPLHTLGVWRPPAREHLIRRQEVQRRQALEHGPEQQTAQASSRRIASEPVQPRQVSFGSWFGESGRPARNSPVKITQNIGPPPPLSTEPRTSRVGRKRQGLESLITENQPTAEEEKT